MEGEYVSLFIKRSTRERLKSIGRKGDTYDDVINVLIDYYVKSRKEEERIPVIQ